MLAKATQDVQGQLGSYDLYYLDQSWVATFAQDTIDPTQYYKDKPDLAMPGFDWDDFSKPLVDGIAMYNGKMVGIPFDIPIMMLSAPIPATKRAFEKTGMTIDDIDLVEINEAFAAQVIPSARHLGIPWEKLNVNGGAIALGHPLGCSGARIVTTLVHEMKRRDAETYKEASRCLLGAGVFGLPPFVLAT